MANEWRCCGCGTVWGNDLSDPACRCAAAFTYQREVKGSLRSKDDHFAPLDSAGAPRGRVMGHSRVEGAQNREGHSAGRTGGASDLPELRSKQEVRIERIDSGSEEAVIAQALDRVAPGGLVVYHRGVTGSAPLSIKAAAMLLHDRGLCLLTQRITADRDRHGERIVDYLAIKTRGE